MPKKRNGHANHASRDSNSNRDDRTHLFRTVAHGDSITVTLPDGSTLTIDVSRTRRAMRLDFYIPSDVKIQHTKARDRGCGDESGDGGDGGEDGFDDV